MSEHKHEWEIISTSIISIYPKIRREMEIACVCGAYKYIKLFKVE